MRKKKPTGPQKGSAREKVDWKALDVVHPDAAGIDVGGSEHWVAVSPHRDPEPLRMFYRGSARDGAVADRQRRSERGHAIDRRVLDAGAGGAGAKWLGSISGECPAHQELTPGARAMCRSVNGG